MAPGTAVTVQRGVYSGMQGHVTGSTGGRIQVEISIFGRATTVSFDPSELISQGDLVDRARVHIDQLGAPRAPERVAAADALAQMGRSAIAARDALLETARVDRSGAVRAAALNALRTFVPRVYDQPLAEERHAPLAAAIEGAAHRQADVRYAAFSLMGALLYRADLSQPEDAPPLGPAIEVLVRALEEEPVPRVRARAGFAAGSLWAGVDRQPQAAPGRAFDQALAALDAFTRSHPAPHEIGGAFFALNSMGVAGQGLLREQLEALEPPGELFEMRLYELVSQYRYREFVEPDLLDVLRRLQAASESPTSRDLISRICAEQAQR